MPKHPGLSSALSTKQLYSRPKLHLNPRFEQVCLVVLANLNTRVQIRKGLPGTRQLCWLDSSSAAGCSRGTGVVSTGMGATLLLLLPAGQVQAAVWDTGVSLWG